MYTITEIAEMISADVSEQLHTVIDSNPNFHKLYQIEDKLATK